jgi:hypothetical protein
MPKMMPVRSSNIAAVGFEDGTLYVEFSNGGTYAVSGSSEAELQDILDSPSPGSYYHRNIKQAGRSVRRV